MQRLALWVVLSSVLLSLLSCSTDAFYVSWRQPEDAEVSDYRSDGPQLANRDVKRGGCQGFPCIFTHLGTKASDATIERIKQSILMDCLNDPHCHAQGRRKRIPPSELVSQKLLFGKRFQPIQDIYDEYRGLDMLQRRKRK